MFCFLCSVIEISDFSRSCVGFSQFPDFHKHRESKTTIHTTSCSTQQEIYSHLNSTSTALPSTTISSTWPFRLPTTNNYLPNKATQMYINAIYLFLFLPKIFGYVYRSCLFWSSFTICNQARQALGNKFANKYCQYKQYIHIDLYQK